MPIVVYVMFVQWKKTALFNLNDNKINEMAIRTPRPPSPIIFTIQ